MEGAIVIAGLNTIRVPEVSLILNFLAANSHDTL